MAILLLLGHPVYAQDENSLDLHKYNDVRQGNVQVGFENLVPLFDDAKYGWQSDTPQFGIIEHGSLETMDETIPDEDIQTAVEAALRSSGLVLSDLKVRVDRGVVFLNGVAKSRRAKRRASQLAHNVPGVSGIVNDITVEPRFSVMPLEITQRSRGQMRMHNRCPSNGAQVIGAQLRLVMPTV
jgi:hypothetical protein